MPTSVLMPSKPISTRHQTDRFRSSSRSTPATINRDFSVTAHHEPPLTAAAHGGLKPPPAGRLQRANQPPSLLQHRKRAAAPPTPSRVRTHKHDLGFVGVQLQPDALHPLGQRRPHLSGLTLGRAVHNRVISKPFKLHRRALTFQPRVECIVGSPRGFSPRGSHGTERDSLPSFRSSHPLHRYARIHSQWANSFGSLSVTPRHQALNRFQVRSRLYFFRAQRIT